MKSKKKLRGILHIIPRLIPGVEGEGEPVGPCEAVPSDLLHPSHDFTFCQGLPQTGH